MATITDTTSHSSNMEKSIFLRFERSVEEGSTESKHEWYVIDACGLKSERELQKGKKLGLFSTTTPPPPPDFPFLPGCVQWESIIYVFGGGKETKTPDVFYFDTRCPNSGWKRGPSMFARRGTPYCAVVDGKIYVMGYSIFECPSKYSSIRGDPNRDGSNGNSSSSSSSSSSSFNPWGEVLDPLLNKWIPLPSEPKADPNPLEPPLNGMREWRCPRFPKAELINVRSHASLDGGKQILVELDSHDEVQFSYNVDGRSWNPNNEIFCSTFRHFETPAIVMDGIMYSYSRKVRAYDLVKRRWFPKAVRGMDEKGVAPPLHKTNAWGSPERNHPTAFLVHVGNGKLCLVWSEWTPYEEKIEVVHCTKFSVCKDSDGEEECGLYAIIESLRVYTIHNVDSLEDCLALQVC